ncbi:unnamed protein product [Phytophthora fragariaefolia]|uniref:Unnamed protein product n=1 Tax=Phytophthora fragariaefolia TaxID=1490495 RepID=A0A9W6TJ05_9STRA|nr:unnamed protein product [Phytophthora fragariaefolia]
MRSPRSSVSESGALIFLREGFAFEVFVFGVDLALRGWVDVLAPACAGGLLSGGGYAKFQCRGILLHTAPELPTNGGGTPIFRESVDPHLVDPSVGWIALRVISEDALGLEPWTAWWAAGSQGSSGDISTPCANVWLSRRSWVPLIWTRRPMSILARGCLGGVFLSLLAASSSGGLKRGLTDARPSNLGVWVHFDLGIDGEISDTTAPHRRLRPRAPTIGPVQQRKELNVVEYEEGSPNGVRTIELTNPPSDAATITRLPGLSWKHFLRDLKAGEIEQIGLLTSSDQPEVLANTVSDDVSSSRTKAAEPKSVREERFAAQS